MNAMTMNPEARSWLRSHPSTSAFAPWRFAGREGALDFVYRLYRAGAVHVVVGRLKPDPAQGSWPTAEALLVEMPEDVHFRTRVFDVINGERSAVGADTETDHGQKFVELEWKPTADPR